MDLESAWDKRLQIHTTGRDEVNADQYRYPYEPTPYCVLERLVNSCLIGPKDVVLDYGCGKGRVDFFLSAQTQANTIGVEYDERIFRIAQENQNDDADSQGNDSGQQVRLAVAICLAVVDDRGEHLGSDGTANAVGGHYNAGISADILLEPPAYNGTGH